MITQEMQDTLYGMLRSCELCPHRCAVDRTQGELGLCGTGPLPVVASAGPHFGEEPVLVGRGGSGTIFFSGCNLACVFCQNYDISQQRQGSPKTADDLAAMMLRLQAMSCVNINWLTPTHQIHAAIAALRQARERGLALPVVYNCGGYESITTLRCIEGAVDIYRACCPNPFWHANSILDISSIMAAKSS